MRRERRWVKRKDYSGGKGEWKNKNLERKY